MNEEDENKNQTEEESFIKTSNNAETKLENLKKDYEYQIQQKNQELEILFEEINNENQELKKELLQTKFDLEEEKEKIKNIKNTCMNISTNNNIKLLQNNQETKNSDAFGTELIYTFLNDNIKIIKENSEKKILELNEKHEYDLKIFLDDKKKLNSYIENLINNKNCVPGVLEEIEKIFEKNESLMNENYNKNKYILALGEKYEIIKEEVFFLKERIFQEKMNILEKIKDMNNSNNITYLNLMQELQSFLENNNNNFFSQQIIGPLENMNVIISTLKKNEKEIENNRYKVECENDILKNKIEILEKEKNELLNKTSIFIFDKESVISENLLYKSEINKLKNEIQILENENNNLLTNSKNLNEELINIKNTMNFDIKKIENNTQTILNQKESMIKELNKSNNKLLQNELKSKNKIEELNEALLLNQQELKDYKEKEISYQNKILSLNKQLSDDLFNSKDTKKMNTEIQEKNKNLELKLESLREEKINIENETNILTNRYNGINVEYNKIKNELNEYKRNKENMEFEIQNLKNKINNLENDKKVLKDQSNLLHQMQKSLKEIYQIHFNNNDINNNISLNELQILKEINEKLSNRNSLINNNSSAINFNEDFANLENAKNSQLYENILLYLIDIKSKNKIELSKMLSEKNYNFHNNSSGEITQSMTANNSSSNYFNKNYYDKLKLLLEDKYRKLEERIRSSITIGELEELLIEIRNLYESVIDSIIQSFYNYKTELSVNNILTINIPLDKYHQIINNTNSNLISIEKSLNKKMGEYRGQGEKIESALSILIKNVNMIY